MATKVDLPKVVVKKALEHQISIMSRGIDTEINPGIKQLKQKDILALRTAIESMEEIK